MTFQEAVEALKTTYSRRILENYGYDSTRKKYTALESADHNNGDKTPSMSLYDRGGNFYLKDFAGLEKMYSAIDVIMLQERLSFVDAVKHGAEIFGIAIDEERPQEELSADMKYIIYGLYRKAKQEGFSVKAITAKYHYLYKDADGKKLYDKYRVDYVDADGTRHKYIVMGKENNGFVKFKFADGEYQSLIAMYGDFRQFKAGEKVYICEGEKCVDSCHSKGLKNVVTVGSSNDFRYKGKKFASYFKDADIVILQDNDQPGAKMTKEIISALGETASSIKVIVPDQSRERADIADFFQNGGTLQQLKEMEEKTEPIRKQSSGGNISVTTKQEAEPLQVNVKELLSCKIDYDSNGNEKSRKILQTVRNFEIAMENDARFAGKIKFDEFSQQTYLMGAVPWEQAKNNYRAWSSYDDSALFSILQSDYGLTSRSDYFDAVKNVSMRNKFHPVREVLDGLVWDGEEHIRNLLPDYLGVEDSDYQSEVMKLWMVGAVSRIYKPGCKFDYTIIFKGRQGLGKSTFLQLIALNDDWFNDSLDSLDSDKAAQSLMGSWIVELAELKSLARTVGGVDSVKKFLTATQDKLRLPYEKRTDVFLRQCVFSGTTNRDDFLQDETGNRRFLIIECGTVERKKNLFNRESLEDFKAAWAQAVHIMKEENPMLILPESCLKQAEDLQMASMADDGKIGIITEYLENKQRVCVVEVWQKALGEQGRPQKWQASEIGNIILSLPEWKRMQSPGKFGEYGSQRGFQKYKLQSHDEGTITGGECSQDFIPISDPGLSELPFD